MRLTVTIDGDIVKLMAAERRAGERAVTRAMAQSGSALKAAWREQIIGAGLGQRVANSIRNATYPKGDVSLNASGLVWTKAPKIVGAHDDGPLIRSANGFWLAIPLPAAGKGARGKKITPDEWERRTGRRLTFIYRRGQAGLLIDDGKKAYGNVMVRRRGRGGTKLAEPTTFRNRTVPIFVLVPQVKLQKSLDIERLADVIGSRIPGLIIANWKGGA